MEADTYTALFLNRLEAVSKAHHMKYSKKAFCVYQALGDVFWSASFLCGSFLADGQLKITVSSRLKPCEADAVQFSIMEPGKKHRITDALRVNASFAAGWLEIDSKTYDFPCGDPAAFAGRAEGYVQAVFEDLLENRTAFLSSVLSNDGGLLPYLINRWETFPLEAGMACLCKRDYSGARRCFALAEKKQRIWRKSIGRPGRYLHLIFMDYCEAAQSGIEWTEDLVVNGFSANAT